jgi:MFS transporter, DHA1 family, tetracycline resistance protein
MTGSNDLGPAIAPEPPKRALAIIFLIVFMDLLGFGIIIPLLPFYVPGYEENPLKVTLLFSIYSICQFVGAPVLGMLSDRAGRRPILVISQLGSALGYLLLAAATQFQWASPVTVLALVYASRVIDGFSGGNISTAQAYISDVTTPANRAKGMGLLGAAFGIGFSIGPAFGGILGHININLPAYAAAFLAAAAALLTHLWLPESREHRPAPSAAARAWLHPSTFIPILRRPVLAQLLAIGFFTMAAFVMMESVLSLFLSGVFGYEKWQIGWFFAFVGVVIVIVQGGLIGRLTRAVGEWPLAITGPVLVGVGMAAFTTSAFIPLLSILLLAGGINAAGRSLQQPTLSSLISKFSDEREQGTVFGLFHGLSSLARVIGPIVAGLAYARHVTAPFIIAAAVVLAAAVWTWALRSVAPAEQRGFEVVTEPAKATG